MNHNHFLFFIISDPVITNEINNPETGETICQVEITSTIQSGTTQPTTSHNHSSVQCDNSEHEPTQHFHSVNMIPTEHYLNGGITSEFSNSISETNSDDEHTDSTPPLNYEEDTVDQPINYSRNNSSASSGSSRISGPIVFIGRSDYFWKLYHKLYNLIQVAEKQEIDLSVYEPQISSVKQFGILSKYHLEYLYSEIDFLVKDFHEDSEFPSDLASTSQESESECTQDNYSQQTAEDNTQEEENTQEVDDTQEEDETHEEDDTQEESEYTQDNDSQHTADDDKQEEHNTQEEEETHKEENAQEEDYNIPHPKIFPQRTGVATTSAPVEQLQRAVPSSFKPPPNGSPAHHIGTLVMTDTQSQRDIKLELHKIQPVPKV